MKKIIFCALLACSSAMTNAQAFKIPDASTGQKIEQDLGMGKISITYSRPNIKGRKVFGNMEPYGAVWRTGANSATVIKLTDTVSFAGNQVAPGEYAFFTIPGKDEWTVIFNKTVKQWGAYTYDAKQDLLRFTVKAARLKMPVETFTIQFTNVTTEHAELHLMWENTDINIPLRTDVEARVMASIDEAMKGEKKPYYSAAVYYYNHNKDMSKALEWMNAYEKAAGPAYNTKYWIARIQLKMGDKATAVATATEGLKLANAEPNAEYIRMNKEVLADAAKQ